MLKTAASKKKVVTLTMAVTAGGVLLTPQVVAGRCSTLNSAQDAFEPRKNKTAATGQRGASIAGLPIDLIATTSHWANVDTIRQLCVTLEEYRKRVIADLPGVSLGAPLVMLWDCAPTHVSAAVRAMMEREFPNIWTLQVPPGTTSALQPLDTHFFGNFKNALRPAHRELFMQKFRVKNAHKPVEGEANERANRGILIHAICNVLCQGVRPGAGGRREINSTLGIAAGARLLEIVGGTSAVDGEACFAIPAADIGKVIAEKVEGRDDLFLYFRNPEHTPAMVRKIRKDAGLPFARTKRADSKPDAKAFDRYVQDFPVFDPAAVEAPSDHSSEADGLEDASLATEDLDPAFDEDGDPRPYGGAHGMEEEEDVDGDGAADDDAPIMTRFVAQAVKRARGGESVSGDDSSSESALADDEADCADDEADAPYDEEDEDEEQEADDDEEEQRDDASVDVIRQIVYGGDSDDEALLLPRRDPR